MADLKLKAEAAQNKWQMLFTLAGQGYNALINEFAEQLNAGLEAPASSPQPNVNANGEDKDAARPQGN